VYDPAILGLGDLELIQRERFSHKAGRLDLLLYDPQDNVRYEVELMLGPTDESHIIRCIEYWDIERRRYPAYDHCAVLVAEDVTTRFLNVLGLVAGSIPFIAIQLNALKVADQIVLSFVRVLDRVPLRTDDVGEQVAAPADCSYWNERASPETVGIADAIVGMLNKKAEPKLQLKFNRAYIGFYDGSRAKNVVYLQPPKGFTYLMTTLVDVEKWRDRLVDAGLNASVQRASGTLRISLKPEEVQPQLTRKQA